MEDNNKDANDDKGISALELDRDQRFSRGNQAHWPHDDDDKEEEEEEEEDDGLDNDGVEDNDKDDNDNKDNNDDKGISALGIDRDLGFLRGYQGYHGN